MKAKPMTDELRFWIGHINEMAKGHGLEYHPTLFEMVTYEEMNMPAAYQGFPVRYLDWRWGMEYGRLANSYCWGLRKI